MSWSTDVFVVDDVKYRYLDRFVALAGVSLTVRAGERVALLGANGCGKSTMLKLLAGLIVPESGTVHAFGTELTEAVLDDDQFGRAFRARVGFVFQSSDAQLFSPTVRDEVSFGPLHLGFECSEVEQRVDDVLALLDIAELADRAPYQLSGGEKKRVAIASVLVTNPDVLLLDEPTAGLDPRTQDLFRALIEERQSLKTRNDVPNHELQRLGPFLKTHANAGSYGIFAETNRNERPKKAKKARLKVFGRDCAFEFETDKVAR